MPEKIKPELLQFLKPAELPLDILVVESLSYLPELRRMFPLAHLYAVAEDDDHLAKYAAVDFEGVRCDYLSEPLPFPRGSFDYILSDLALERAGNAQDIAAGFSQYLRETGSWLTSFRNIRFWAEIRNLMEGHYYHVGSKLFAKPEFQKLLYASYYKNVHMRPQVRKAPDGLIEAYVQAGFDNLHDDLETEFWLVKADRSMPELSLLKSMYTKEQRTELSRLLHRIEYGVQPEQSAESFWTLYARIGLFPEYTAQFVHEAVFHIEQFYGNLASTSPGHEAEVRAMAIAEHEWETPAMPMESQEGDGEDA